MQTSMILDFFFSKTTFTAKIIHINISMAWKWAFSFCHHQFTVRGVLLAFYSAHYKTRG